MTIIETMAKAIWDARPGAWITALKPNTDSAGTYSRSTSPVLWDDDDMRATDRDATSVTVRAALRSVKPSDIGNGMVEIARLELIPMADECFMDDHRDECLAVIRRAIAAAIAKGGE